MQLFAQVVFIERMHRLFVPYPVGHCTSHWVELNEYLVPIDKLQASALCLASVAVHEAVAV